MTDQRQELLERISHELVKIGFVGEHPYRDAAAWDKYKCERPQELRVVYLPRAEKILDSLLPVIEANAPDRSIQRLRAMHSLICSEVADLLESIGVKS